LYRTGDIIAGEYAVSHVYTNGGMGIVYKVHRTRWDVDMAMKCPRRELFENANQRKGFVKECETWMALGAHPNIVSCYYIKTIDSVPAVLMEYADGGSLLDYISSGRLYSGTPKDALRRILDLAIQTARGLLHAHQKGFVHQDVKPANVLLTGAGIAKVSDFGLSKAKGLLPKSKVEMPGRSMIVSSGGWTPAYGSPEQALGLPLTRRTDVWSWAVMVLEMVHGEMFWKAGPLVARALQKLWPWQVFSSKVESSRGLMKVLRECLEEHEERRPKDFDVIISKLVSLYKDLCGEEYPRRLPPEMLMAETTLCNRIASYAELEVDGKDYFGEVYDTLNKLRSISPWSVWGELNYAVYAHAHGVTIEKIHRIIENLLRRASSVQEKEWLLDLLLSLGLTSVRDSKVLLLNIANNSRFLERVKRARESLRDRLNDIFREEKIRCPEVDEFDIDRFVCREGVSENAVVRVRVERKSTENGCSVSVVADVGGKSYRASEDYLPTDARIEYVTTDDKAIKVSLWIWVPQRGLYQKVFGLQGEEFISYRCDFRKKEDWGIDVWDVPRGVHVSGDARITMLRYKGGICSVWFNERGDAGDGRNICVINLSDFGLIPPETILPGLRLEYGFEYGVSCDTAYRLMRMLAKIYGNVRTPCHISRPESSDAELLRSNECAAYLSQAAWAYETDERHVLTTAISHCLQYGVLPNDTLLFARHQIVQKSADAVLRRCWHSASVDEYWDSPISALFSYRPSVYQIVSYGLRPRLLTSGDGGLKVQIFSWAVDERLVRGNAKEPSYISLCACENDDIIVAVCDGWYAKNIYRVSNAGATRQSVVWECQVPNDTMRIRLLEAWQTDRTLSFLLADDRFVRIDKASGRVREGKTSGRIRFWTDSMSEESPFAEIHVTDSDLAVFGKNGEVCRVPGMIRDVCVRNRLCGISRDGRLILIWGDWDVSVGDVVTGDVRKIYAIDPFSLNRYGLGGSRAMLCAISPNGRAVAVVTVDRRLKVVDTVSVTEVFEWKLDDGKYGPMQFDSTGRWLAIVRDDKKIEAFQLFWE